METKKPANNKIYPDVDANPDFAKLEHGILKFWKDNNIFKKSIEIRSFEGKQEASQNHNSTHSRYEDRMSESVLNSSHREVRKPSGGLTQQNSGEHQDREFIFYDGPPFANGLPHYGHLLTGFVKDLFARYQTMQGKKVERRFGWDCHGLPAEMAAEKELGISGKQAIEKFGIENFNAYCEKSVMKYAHEWEEYVNRQARWVDFANDYKTMDITYMESVMWAFKTLFDKGLIYESFRVMPYSWAMETPVSNFETRMDNSYRERTDKAITVAFELEKKPQGAPDANKYFMLAWTTTPWTLPANLALAVSEKLEYWAVINPENKNCYIFASFASAKYLEAILGKDKEKDIAFTFNKISGEKLVGIKYKPLFPYFAKHPGAFKILAADFIEEGSGTGIVHIAPGFGEDDQRVAEANGISIVCPVDSSGKYTSEIYDIPMNPPLPSRERAGERGYSDNTLTNAKELRKNPTEAEKKLWHHLQGKSFKNLKFRRQQPIGKYIADFFCSEKNLIIELDGGQHSEQQSYDQKRTEFFESEGYKVLRFWNNDVLQNIEGVFQKISETINTPHPTSPSKGEEMLHLQGLNVVVDKNKSPDEPYKPEQLEKYGLANLRIIDWLKKQNQLIHQEDYKHNYPHCWRTDTPLIYRALPSWYVEVTKFNKRMVELNQKINWIPEHIKEGRFGKWLEGARDWSISRNRYWGAPIPIWRTESGKIKCFGSIQELEDFFGSENIKKAGLGNPASRQPGASAGAPSEKLGNFSGEQEIKITNLHRPFIDQLTKTENGETWRRVPDVLDCWFESGSMPFAQVHYPFENKDWFENHFPADFIVEYEAQTRGWFYTLMVLGTALFDKPPFKNVICHGVVLDDKGHKLSKSKGNYVDPKEIFEKFGADALRWLMLSSPIMHGNELYIDKEGKFIRDVVRLYIKPIWNAYNFFTLYANADGVEAANCDLWLVTCEKNSQSTIHNPQITNLMDRYILAKLREAVTSIETALDSFNTPPAYKAIENFFEILNNWYIRRSKERFWKTEKDEDKQAAYDTLYTCLVTMCKASASLIPLIAEEIFQGLNAGESVHLENFPDVKNFREEHQLTNDMDRVRDICNTALAIRNEQKIRVRQPLETLTIVAKDVDTASRWQTLYGKEIAEIIKDEINVKFVNEGDKGLDDYAAEKLQINFPILGKRLPEKMKQIIPASKKGEWKKTERGIEILGEILTKEEATLQLEPKPEFAKNAKALSTNDALVVLDLTITKELEQEGIARDIVRMIQQARKDASLIITDKIALSISAEKNIEDAANKFSDYIKEQTLAKTLEIGLTKRAHNFENDLDGVKVKLSFSVSN